MSDTHNKLQYGNNYIHRKILDLVLYLNYFSFSNLNPTHLPKHRSLSPNHQLSQRIWYAEYHSVHAHMAEVRNFAWHQTCPVFGDLWCRASSSTRHVLQVLNAFHTQTTDVEKNTLLNLCQAIIQSTDYFESRLATAKHGHVPINKGLT